MIGQIQKVKFWKRNFKSSRTHISKFVFYKRKSVLSLKASLNGQHRRDCEGKLFFQLTFTTPIPHQ